MDLTAMTIDDLVELQQAIALELDRKRTLEDAPQAMEHLARAYADAVADEPPVPFAPVPHHGHGPGTVVLFDGHQWRNTSGTWLTVSPQQHPDGWNSQNEEGPQA